MADQVIPAVEDQPKRRASNCEDQPPLKKSSSNVPITLNIRYKNEKFLVQCDLYDTLKELKEKLDQLTDVPPNVQKLVNKSISSVKRDDATTILKDLNLIDGQILLLVGATRGELLSTNEMKTTSRDFNDQTASTSSKKESLCKQTRHEKVLKTGKPENVPIGIRNRHELLPTSIDGLLMSILNQSAKKARLTFKLELDELWINTAEVTKRIPMSHIQNIVDEPIEGHEEYSIIGFQTGTTENSTIWIYWCPSQYVKSIRREVLSDK